MKKLSNKSKLLLPIAPIAISCLAIATANISFHKQNNELNQALSSRSISNNTNQKNNLTNPNELFYTNSKLDQTVNPWDSGQKKANEANLKKWKSFDANLKNIAETSAIKDELLEIVRQVLGVVSLQESYVKLDELTDLPPAAIQAAKDSIKQNTGFKESITEVEGVDTIGEKLLAMSGIAEGTKIALNETTIKLTDLGQEVNTSPNPKPFNLNRADATATSGVESVAGTGYTQLVKIAEIDPAIAGNYALSFKWKKTQSSASVVGNLIIKNDNSQLTTNKDDLSKLISSLDVFGRWSLGSTGVIGQAGYNQEMENFIIQAKTDNNKTTIEVLVRLKSGESFSDLQWATDALLPGASSLTKGSKFGILDVQADGSKTFKSAILNPNPTTTPFKPSTFADYPTSGKLVDNINDTNAKLIKKVRFFSDSLISKPDSKQGTSRADGTFLSTKANRKLTFYQYENITVALPLYYAVGAQSDATAHSYSYAPINIYTNGVDSKAQQTIALETTSTDATTLSPATYNMFSDLKEALPEAAKKDFQDASKIQLTSTLDTTTKITTQELHFYDGFYAIGNRDDGWSSIDTQNDIKMIRIADPTSKVFLENPKDAGTTTKQNKQVVSGIRAQETINERSAVLSILGSVYEQFSKSSGSDFEGKTYEFVSGKWVSTSGNYSGIVYKNILVKGNVWQIYNDLNNAWKDLSPIMNKLFPNLGTKADRYSISETNSAKTIVESYIAYVSEFSVNASELENKISEAINVVKSQGDITETTSYTSLTEENKKKLADIMVDLIRIQFGTIANEFNLRLNTPLYDALVKTIGNIENKINVSIQTPTTFLQTRNIVNGTTGLIYYKDNQINNIIKNGEVTVKEAVKSIFELLYFSSANTYLGSSIYGASTPDSSNDLLNLFESLNSTSLTSFDSDVFSTQKDKVQIYNKLFTTFTNINLQSYIEEMLKLGNAVSVDRLSNTLKTGFIEIIQKISGKIKRSGKSISSETVSSYFLDDILSGTNAVISLKWRLNKIISENSSNVELKNKIIEILKSNEQASSYELSVWSSIIKGSYDYQTYTSEFSGRNGISAADEIAKKIILDNIIMTTRSKDTIAAAVVLEKIVSYAWWIIVALIGVGVVVSSTIGMATKDQRVKLSSRPVLKWILISGIILGLGILGIALAIGIPPILI